QRPAPPRGRGGRAGAGHLPPVARRRAAPPGRGRRAGRTGPVSTGPVSTGPVSTGPVSTGPPGHRRAVHRRTAAMIAQLEGTVSAVARDGGVIDVGGVGLQVQCTPGTLAGLRLGERTRVAASLVVREDALSLYGFADSDERNPFELLQTASGVGPRLALAMLAVFSPDGLRRAV